MKALLLVALTGMAFPAQADIYKCQDVGGRTVYQEDPCEKANLKTVKKLAKPAGEPSPEAIEKAQAEAREFIQRYNERKKAEQEAAKKEQQKAEPPKTAPPGENRAGAE